MLRFIYVLLILNFQLSFESETSIKRIVVVLFPGGKKINKQLKQLIDYSKEKYDVLEWHIVLYKTDYEIWKDYEPFIYSFGQSSYLYQGIKDLHEEPSLPVFSHTQKQLRWFYQEFLESNVMKSIKHISFDMLITDIPNYIAALIAIQMNIPLRIIASMRPQPQLFYGIFEFNSNYYPVIGSEFTDNMSYRERCSNVFKYWSNSLIQYISRYEIRHLFKLFGYSIEDRDCYLNDTLVMIQYPKGIGFPLSVPPNFILLNAILPTQSPFDTTTSIHFRTNTVIVITDEASSLLSSILPFIMEKNSQIEFYIWNELKDKDHSFNVLMACEAVIGLVTTGDLNVVAQSIYHFKPVVVIGNGQRDATIKAFIKKNNCGVVVNTVEVKEVEEAIKKVTSPENLYKRNAKKYGNILKGNRNAKEEFAYWISYGFSHNYTTLNVPLYKKGSWIQVSCLDVFVCLLVLALVALFVFMKLTAYLYRRIKAKVSRKVKQE